MVFTLVTSKLLLRVKLDVQRTWIHSNVCNSPVSLALGSQLFVNPSPRENSRVTASVSSALAAFCQAFAHPERTVENPVQKEMERNPTMDFTLVASKLLLRVNKGK